MNSTMSWTNGIPSVPATFASCVQRHYPAWGLEVLRKAWAEQYCSREEFDLLTAAASLDEAIREEHHYFAKMLLDGRARQLAILDANQLRCCPLGLRVAQTKCPDLLEVLLESAAPLVSAEGYQLVMLPGCEGKTPLHSAAANGWADGVRLLLKYGADVDAKDSAGCRPVTTAVACMKKGGLSAESLSDFKEAVRLLEAADSSAFLLPVEMSVSDTKQLASPKSLQQLCRITIRRHLTPGSLPLTGFSETKGLYLPRVVTDFLNLEKELQRPCAKV